MDLTTNGRVNPVVGSGTVLNAFALGGIVVGDHLYEYTV